MGEQVIVVDNHCHTGVARVYAVGDVASGSMFSPSKAQQMGILAARALFSVSGMMDTEKVIEWNPQVLWSIPEVAWVGLSEDMAKLRGIDIGTARADFDRTIRGIVTSQSGFLKLVFERNTGKILGVHLFGDNSSELVNYGAELVNEGLTFFQVLHFVFPAVTYHQLYHQASMEAKLRFKGARGLEDRVQCETTKLPSASHQVTETFIGA